MHEDRKFVLSLAGFDPSGGAGILADIKSIEQQKAYGLAINTALTLQTEKQFEQLSWQTSAQILQGLNYMLKHYPIKAIKIGIIPSLGLLHEVLSTIKQHNSSIKIIWDTVLKSTTGQAFVQASDEFLLHENLNMIDLITPNWPEVMQLKPNKNALASAEYLAQFTAVLLKGGHNENQPGYDHLFLGQKQSHVLAPQSEVFYGKHGTGCILSSAIAAHLAQGKSILEACLLAKSYLEKVALSHPGLLAYHS